MVFLFVFQCRPSESFTSDDRTIDNLVYNRDKNIMISNHEDEITYWNVDKLEPVGTGRLKDCFCPSDIYPVGKDEILASGWLKCCNNIRAP